MTTQKQILSPENRQRFLRYRWVVYSTQVACLAVVFFEFVVSATIGERLAREWDLSAASLGFLGSVLFYLYALMQIPAGYLADIWGPRRLVTAAMLVMATGQILFSQAPTLGVALLGRAFTGLGAAVVLVAILKILVNWFRVNEFATLLGVSNLVASGGSVLGTAPLAILVTHWGWRLPLLLVGGLTLVLAILNWVLVRDDPRELGLPPISQIDPNSHVTAPDMPLSLDASSIIKEAVLTWLRTPTIWVVSLLIFVGWGSFGAFQALWAGPYLIHVHHKSPVTAGTSLLLLSIGIGLGLTVSGYLSDKVRLRRPFLITGVLGGAVAWAGILITTGGASTTFINITFLLLSFSAGFMLIGQTMVKEVVQPAIFGTVFGIVNIFPFFGNALFQLLMGTMLNLSGATLVEGSRIYSPTGYSSAFIPVLVLTILCLILSLFVPESLKRIHAELTTEE